MLAVFGRIRHAIEYARGSVHNLLHFDTNQ